LSYKQRDSLDRTRRSVFYCLVVKIMFALAETEEFKALKVLQTTVNDVAKFDEVQGIEEASSKEMTRIVLCHRFAKLCQTSILLHVNLSTKSRA